MMEQNSVLHKARMAKVAAVNLGTISTAIKNTALQKIAQRLLNLKQDVLSANRKDVAIAERAGIAKPLLKRLLLTEGKFHEMVQGIRDLVKLPDPVGQTLYAMELDKGLELYRVTCPIGVIGAVFEARPDALVQISCLCLKSGNAVLLKGGSEAVYSNRILVDIIMYAVEKISSK
ncbi:MAG: gamma-glutamyl-phosphate reductase, partial [Patescibacteria group bacterium]|nr:gamma-glutamyl-phosphate reductase [Patescibacteria group bacterium]